MSKQDREFVFDIFLALFVVGIVLLFSTGWISNVLG
jgi:hypothetical protein